MSVGARVIRENYVSSEATFDSVFEEGVTICNAINARMQINLNQRSFAKVALKTMEHITKQLLGDNPKAVKNSYSKMVGQVTVGEKLWVVDVDEVSIDSSYLGTLNDFITTLPPEGSKVVEIVPSKTGVHLITRPFRLDVFKVTFPEIDVHKNSPTNLYIP
jgi:hypothetical protein